MLCKLPIALLNRCSRVISSFRFYKHTYIEKNYLSKCLIDVSKLCAELYFKRFEELSWAGYTFPKFKVSGLNITSDIRLLVEACLVTRLD